MKKDKLNIKFALENNPTNDIINYLVQRISVILG